jgi:hypothetical protein
MAYLGVGHLCDEDRRQRSETPQGGVERGGASRRQGAFDVDGRLSFGIPALSKEPHQPRPVGARRLRQEVYRLVHGFPVDVVQPSKLGDRAAHPWIFQYYSIAEDELQKTFAGKQSADNVAAAWEKLTDKLGQQNQVKYYRIAMGLA